MSVLRGALAPGEVTPGVSGRTERTVTMRVISPPPEKPVITWAEAISHGPPSNNVDVVSHGKSGEIHGESTAGGHSDELRIPPGSVLDMFAVSIGTLSSTDDRGQVILDQEQHHGWGLAHNQSCGQQAGSGCV